VFRGLRVSSSHFAFENETQMDFSFIVDGARTHRNADFTAFKAFNDVDAVIRGVVVVAAAATAIVVESVLSNSAACDALNCNPNAPNNAIRAASFDQSQKFR
jgi:hypothetical protein